MNEQTCPECSAEISGHLETCSQCGFPLINDKESTSDNGVDENTASSLPNVPRMWAIPVLCLALLLVLGGALDGLPIGIFIGLVLLKPAHWLWTRSGKLPVLSFDRLHISERKNAGKFQIIACGCLSLFLLFSILSLFGEELEKNSVNNESVVDERTLENAAEQLRIERERAELERLRLIEKQRAAEQREKDMRRHLVNRYSEEFAKLIIEDLGGGQDIVVSVQSWDYDSVLERFKINMVVSFNGALFRSNNYQFAGQLRVNRDGSSLDFARTAQNQNFKELNFNIGALKVSGEVIKALNQE